MRATLFGNKQEIEFYWNSTRTPKHTHRDRERKQQDEEIDYIFFLMVKGLRVRTKKRQQRLCNQYTHIYLLLRLGH